jgi:hypothetical protein
LPPQAAVLSAERDSFPISAETPDANHIFTL